MMAALLTLLLSQTPPPEQDREPPVIEDVAVASENPQAAPIVTVVMFDRGTGVGASSIFFRSSPDDAWQTVELKRSGAGLFLARLPDGLQVSGFSYYIEAYDIAGNGPERIGSAAVPLHVERATMSTLQRLEQERMVEPAAPLDPAFLMVSLGVSVLAGAGSAAFALDLVDTNLRLAEVANELLRTDNSDERRSVLLSSQAQLENAAVGDGVITATLGVVAVAGLVTALTLVVLSAVPSW